MGGERRVQALTICNPLHRLRGRRFVSPRTGRLIAFLFGFFGAFWLQVGPAAAQGITLLQDTETELLLRSV